MEQQVIFRDRQELQAADLNNIETYADAALVHVVSDAVTSERRYTGFVVAATGAAEITTDTGRLYQSGQVFAKTTATVSNLFAYLPVATKKIVAVVVWGETTETTVEPRDFLVDLTTGATEPQAVPMVSARVANVNIVAGVESADPVAPAVADNTLVVAYVTLSPSGVDSVDLQVVNRLPSVAENAADIDTLEVWQGQVGPQIEAITTSIAALETKTDSKVDWDRYLDAAGDIAMIKDKLDLPADYADYDADFFGDEDKSETEFVGYSAQIDYGLTFPAATSAALNVALFNPYDSAVVRSATDLILPSYSHASKVRHFAYAGDTSLSEYTVQAVTFKKRTRYVYRFYYGGKYYSRRYLALRTAYYGALLANDDVTAGQRHLYKRYLALYKKAANASNLVRTPVSTQYYPVTTGATVNGVLVAQTFLCPSSFWLTKVGLWLTKVGTTGDLTILITGTASGKPVIDDVVTSVTVPVASLRKYPTQTAVVIPPVFVEAGTRYAIVLITQGDHRAVVSAGTYTDGTLFYGTDGEYFTGTLDKDLAFQLWGAAFAKPRTEVVLESAALAGGMTEIDIDAEMEVPQSCEMTYEYQVGGVWHNFDAPGALASAPNLVPVRAVFVGTRDAAPALQLTTDAMTAAKLATSFTHVSTARTLAAPTDSVRVKVVLSGFDSDDHAIACRLVTDLGVEIATPSLTTTTERVVSEDETETVKDYVFAVTDLSTYRIEITGTRDAAAAPFVVVERTDVAL